jgi:hypothetical protein
MEKRKSLFLSASVYYTLIFFAGGGYTSYIGLYYASVKLNNSQIGIISSIGLLVGMLAQPMWGTIAVFQFFGNAVVPIGDSITLELAKNEGLCSQQ